MESGDIPQVTEIDREAFPTELHVPSYTQRLGSRLAHYLVAYMDEDSPEQTAEASTSETKKNLISRFRNLFAAEPAAETHQYIVGFAGFWLMLGEAHIVDIAVRKAYRGSGIGELLLISTIDLAVELGADVVTLEVRASNSPAQALYRKYGFAEKKKRRGYYTDNREDALIMTTDKISSESYQALFQRLKRAHSQRWGQALTP
jgi:ribosomal-protein-alanine N-acetyltransferase